MSELIEKLHNKEDVIKTILYHCKSYNKTPFFRSDLKPSESVKFRGASGRERTMHENLFHYMFPHFDSQVAFGTGRNGLMKYGSKKFTADFYDRKLNLVVEIDGNGHNEKHQREKDGIKTWLLSSENIHVTRFRNDEVEELLKKLITMVMRQKNNMDEKIVDSGKLLNNSEINIWEKLYIDNLNASRVNLLNRIFRFEQTIQTNNNVSVRYDSDWVDYLKNYYLTK